MHTSVLLSLGFHSSLSVYGFPEWEDLSGNRVALRKGLKSGLISLSVSTNKAHPYLVINGLPNRPGVLRECVLGGLLCSEAVDLPPSPTARML